MSTSAQLTVSFTLDVDAATTTVSALKELISALGRGETFQSPTVALAGHELRDAHTLAHYGIHAGVGAPDQESNTIQILRPPKDSEESVNLRFETDTEHRFSIKVNDEITVAQLKREIVVEEKIDVRRLQALVHTADSEADEMTLQELDDDAVVSQLALQEQVISVTTLDRKAIAAGKRPAAAEFTVRVSVDERGNGKVNTRFPMVVRGTQTLAEFEDSVLLAHFINLPDYALVLESKELKDDGATLDALGVFPGCIIYAVADVNICVTTSNRQFDMAVSPMTRISTVRSELEKRDADFPWEQFSFSLTGNDRLPETWTMWDLGFITGVEICLKRRFLSLTIFLRKGHKRVGPTYDIEVEEFETVETMKHRIFALSGVPPAEQLLLASEDDLLLDHMVIRDERAKMNGQLEMIDLRDLDG